MMHMGDITGINWAKARKARYPGISEATDKRTLDGSARYSYEKSLVLVF